jgi:hypothetical protein
LPTRIGSSQPASAPELVPERPRARLFHAGVAGDGPGSSLTLTEQRTTDDAPTVVRILYFRGPGAPVRR